MIHVVTWDSLTIVLAMTVVLIGLVTLARWRRHAHSTGTAGSKRPNLTLAVAPEEAERVIEEGALFVPLPNRSGEALVVGSPDQLAVLDTAGLFEDSNSPAVGPLSQTLRNVLAISGAEATHRTNAGIDSGRIVALSKETMEQLKKNPAAHDKKGRMLGLVRGKKGFKHVMRLEKAGAKTAMASNAATLAMTAAVSQQLAHIERQLTEIRETLDQMREDAALKKLTDAMATNYELGKLADNIRRRGYMTEADQNFLAGLNLDVTQNALEADLKVTRLLSNYEASLPRNKRVELLDDLLEKRSLDLWLALRVETDLAATRRDLLDLYWEQTHEPQALGRLVDEIRDRIRERQLRMQELGRMLDDLADPASRRRLDPLKQISRRRLAKRDKIVGEILIRHGDAFSGPMGDPFAVGDLSSEEVFILRTGSRMTR